MPAATTAGTGTRCCPCCARRDATTSRPTEAAIIDYAAVKSVHLAAAALSIALFGARGAWLLAAPQRVQPPWMRIPPHVVDTVLLLSALWLAAQQPAGSPHAWLAAKVVALVVYVVLGTLALRGGRSRAARGAVFVAALATFGYIVTVALTRSPLGFLAWR